MQFSVACINQYGFHSIPQLLPLRPPRRRTPHNHGNGIGMPEMRPSLSALLAFITLTRRAVPPPSAAAAELARRPGD